VSHSRALRPTLVHGVTIVLGAGATATGATSKWRAVTPRAAEPPYLLNAVTALSPDEALAVGQTQQSPLVARWSDGRWTSEPLADTPRTIGAGLLGVDAVSPDAAIAVGGAYDRLAGSEIPLIQHWDGMGWKAADLAADLGDGYVLTDVAMLSTTEAWAVGHGFPQNRVSGPVALHWTPAGWSRTGTPDLTKGKLLAVAATAPDDVWAVGAVDRQALILHYDGVAWRRTRVPRTLGPLSDVAALSTTEAWAVGGGMLRWNGRAWRRVKDLPFTSANTVTALSPTDIWVAGGGGGLAHFDGHGWSRGGSPPPLSGSAVWLGSASAAPGTVWVVGSRQGVAPTEERVALAEREDGVSTSRNVRQPPR
jgi:hypothetical protein